MATFTGTSGDDSITPTLVSAGVIADGASVPGFDADTLDGGAGNDTLDGGDGGDLILGGDGDDLIRAEFFVFDDSEGGGGIIDPIPGEPSNVDTVDGGAGLDAEVLTVGPGTAAIDILASADHALVSLNGTAVVDLDNVETIGVNATGAAVISVGELSATEVRTVNVNLAGVDGLADNQADTVIVAGRIGGDTFTTTAGPGGTSVAVINASTNQTTNISALDASDTLVFNLGDGTDRFVGFSSVAHVIVNGGGGDDVIFGAVNETLNGEAGNDRIVANTGDLVDGGAGNDSITGNVGAQTLGGGDGHDTIRGFASADVISGGEGNDRFDWTIGDGADSVDGGAGLDEQVLAPVVAARDDAYTLSANGGQLLTTVNGVGLNIQNVETVTLVVGDGQDRVVIDDLSATSVRTVNVSLGGADLESASVFLNQSAGNDRVVVSEGIGVTVASTVGAVTQTVQFSQLGPDFVTINAGDGDDVVDLVSAPFLLFRIEGGAGNDTLTGSSDDETLDGGAGNDLIQGGASADVLIGGDGDDRFIWRDFAGEAGPFGTDNADDVDGGEGLDTQVLVDFAGQSENFTLSAGSDGTIANNVVFANVDGVEVRLRNIESIEVNAADGTDNVVINDLTATSVRNVDVVLGGADGQGASVTVVGVKGDDVFTVSAGKDATSLSAADSAAGVLQTTSISAFDRLDQVRFDLGVGDDLIDLTNTPTLVNITVSGGDGNDTVTSNGHARIDFHAGEVGSDVITNFHVGFGSGDVIGLFGFFDDRTFAELVADRHILQSGADVVVTDGINTVVTLQNTLLSSLGDSDFLFG